MKEMQCATRRVNAHVLHMENHEKLVDLTVLKTRLHTFLCTLIYTQIKGVKDPTQWPNCLTFPEIFHSVPNFYCVSSVKFQLFNLQFENHWSASSLFKVLHWMSRKNCFCNFWTVKTRVSEKAKFCALLHESKNDLTI